MSDDLKSTGLPTPVGTGNGTGVSTLKPLYGGEIIRDNPLQQTELSKEGFRQQLFIELLKLSITIETDMNFWAEINKEKGATWLPEQTPNTF